MNRKISITGANKVFFAFTVSFMVFQVILIAISIVITLFQGPDAAEGFLENNLYGILLINQYAIILVPVLVYVLINRISIREVFRIRKLGILPALLITAMAIPAQYAAGMLNTIVLYILQFIGNIEPPKLPVPQNLGELLVGILIIGVSPAICEELLHRGVLLSAYERRGSYRAMIITGIFFGIFHFDITNLVGPTALGILFAYYVLRTNSIFAGVLAHFLNNSFAEVVQYLLRNSISEERAGRILPGELLGSIILGFAGMLILAGLLTVFKYVTEKTAKTLPPISSVKQDVISIVTHWPILVILILYIAMGAFNMILLMMSRSGSIPS